MDIFPWGLLGGAVALAASAFRVSRMVYDSTKQAGGDREIWRSRLAKEGQRRPARIRTDCRARERKAIVDGLRDSVLNFEEAVQGVDPHEVMALLMMTQYFDALRHIGGQSNPILLPHSPSPVSELYMQLRNASTVGNLAAAKSMEKPPEKQK